MKKNEQVHTDCDARTAAIRNRYVLEHSERVVFAALDSAGALARLVGDYPALKYQVLAWSNEEIYGVGAGEGLAAVRGYQSEAEGAAVAMPTPSREIETVWAVTLPLPGANSAFAARSESAPYRVPPMFVAECDIRKFFDSISHDVVRRRWREMGFDAAAERVLAAYLDVYAAGTLGNGRDARCPSGWAFNGRDARCPSGETPVVPVSTGETPVVPVAGRSTGEMPVVPVVNGRDACGSTWLPQPRRGAFRVRVCLSAKTSLLLEAVAKIAIAKCYYGNCIPREHDV